MRSADDFAAPQPPVTQPAAVTARSRARRIEASVAHLPASSVPPSRVVWSPRRSA